MKWLVSIAAFAITAIGIGAAFIVLKEPIAARYPVRGIDVSHHQGKIDWAAVARANISFAYIKATEGQNLVDDRFTANWQDATQAGVTRGAYHFFTFCSAGLAQADNFITHVPVAAASLPPAVDVEFAGNCENPPNRRAIRQELHALLEALARRYGRTPMIYISITASWLIIDDTFTQYPIWIRNLYAPPWLMGTRRWTLWQHHDNAAIPGVVDAVDLNVFNGDLGALRTCVEQGNCLPLR